jgi:hypothetical protein
MSLHSRLALSVLLALAICSPAAQGQSSTPPSPATEQPSPQTSPTVSTALQTLLPLAEQALESSKTSDQRLIELALQIEQDRLQKIADDKQRQIEQEQRRKESQDSAQAYKTLSDRVAALQNYSDISLKLLGDFSGSEEQKQAAALAALAKIQTDADALAFQVSILKFGCITFGVSLGAVAVYEGGRALKAWK